MVKQMLKNYCALSACCVVVLVYFLVPFNERLLRSDHNGLKIGTSNISQTRYNHAESNRHFNTKREDTPDYEHTVTKPPLQEPRHCIEDNICKDTKRNSDIYYYKRTNFDILVETPVNINASVNNSYQVVPRKVHFCLFSDGNLTFRFHYMIAFMAASRFVKPERIYFWHDNLPVGDYWEETRKRVKNLYLVHRERPKRIRGNNVSVVEHVADIVRLEALLEFGGMYFDTDSIVVNPIDPILKYDVTMGHAVSFVLANGIMFSKPWSDFFKIWHKEYKTFNDKDWGGHSVIKPFKLSQKYPNLIHIEDTSLCRPNWKELPHLFGGKTWDWQKNNYVVHLYMRFGPKVERTPENIKTWNTTAGSIMRYIYYADASLIED